MLLAAGLLVAAALYTWWRGPAPVTATARVDEYAVGDESFAIAD